MRSILCAVLLLSTPVAAAAPGQKAAEAKTEEAAKEAKAEPPFDPAQLVAVFDKMFPAQPDPDPARLALARTTVQSLLPDGTYARMMDGVMGGVVDRIMDLSEADFGAKGKDGKPPSKETLRQAALKEDPHFEERMRIMERVIGEEMAKISRIIEPKLRDGLARSMARRFDARQLTDINAFLATDTGRAFGNQSMAMWVDPDVLRAMMGSFPEVMEAMPAAMKRLEAETAHLPKPKKKTEAKKDDASGDEK
jgi:hypothetical protein